MMKLGIILGFIGFLLLFISNYIYATHELTTMMFLIGLFIILCAWLILLLSREKAQKILLISLIFIGGCFAESQTAWWFRRLSYKNFLVLHKPALDSIVMEIEKYDKNFMVFHDGTMRYDNNKIDSIKNTFLIKLIGNAQGYTAVKDSKYIYIGTSGFLDERQGIGIIKDESLKKEMKKYLLNGNWYVMYDSKWMKY